jgi:murein DD-endopeptidase MepM/ murein hydrolase activator NlpD
MDPLTAKMAVQLSATLARNRGVRYLLVALVLLILAANLALVFGPWMLTAQLTAAQRGQRQATTDGGSCGGSADVIDTKAASAGSLSVEQVGNARTIWRVAQQLGAGDQGAVVGIATALQESGLRNLSYGDRDSVGLFQQRASWGSVAIRTDPAQSARLFYVALAKVQGWRELSVTRAAQAVQRSAFPTAYAKHEKPATGLVALFRSKAKVGTPQAVAAVGSAMCGRPGAALCPATGMAVEARLAPDALRVLRCLKARWPQLSSFAGVGDRPANVDSDHQEGRAVDAMVPAYESAEGRRLGRAIADWAVADHAKLGVKYVIWDSRIWNVERAQEGWRTCGLQARCYSGSDDTAAHRDHVHVSVLGDQAAAQLAAPTGPLVRPVDHYALTARFGQCSSHWAHCHTGLDFAAGTGTPIRAIMGGTVVWTTWGGAYGNLTKIQHADGVQSWYAHQLSREVRVGDVVTAGQIIGRVGSTGNVTGPHLHLEVRTRGTPVAPDRWLAAHGVVP